MIKSILKRIWAQRRSNTWLFVECFVVFLLLGYLIDSSWQYLIGQDVPKGFSIENVYDIEMGYAPEKVKGLSDTELAEFKRNSALAIKSHLESNPIVETVTFYNGCHFFWGDWTDVCWIVPEKKQGCLQFNIDENYFKVFKPEIIEGTDDLMKGNLKNIWNSDDITRNVMVSKELADLLFTSDTAFLEPASSLEHSKMKYSDMIGKTFYDRHGGKIRLIGITATTQHRSSFQIEFCKYIYKPFSDKTLSKDLSSIAVKVKDGTKLRLEKFERGPYYLEKVQSFEEYKEGNVNTRLEYTAVAIFIFLIFNIFFGIFGSFWYRINQRTSEIGLRLSIGASGKKVMHELILEAILILTIASIPVIIVGANLFYLEIPTADFAPISTFRFLRIFTISYLILAIMVVFGTWLPARRVMKIEPAIALKEE